MSETKVASCLKKVTAGQYLAYDNLATKKNKFVKVSYLVLSSSTQTHADATSRDMGPMGPDVGAEQGPDTPRAGGGLPSTWFMQARSRKDFRTPLPRTTTLQ